MRAFLVVDKTDLVSGGGGEAEAGLAIGWSKIEPFKMISYYRIALCRWILLLV